MKKLISILTVLVLTLSFTVVAFAGSMPEDEKNVNDVKAFNPREFTAAQASSINLDGVKDAGYGDDAIEIKKHSTHDNFTGTGATAKAWTAWTADHLCVYIEVADRTNQYGGAYWETDGVEFFVDYDQKADGSKVLFNRYCWEGGEDIYAAQISIIRGESKTKPSTSVAGVGTFNTTLKDYLMEKTQVKVVDNGQQGYIVEAKIPLKDGSGKYMNKSKVLGFSVNINDDPGGSGRQNMTCTTASIQAFAWQYTNLMDNLTLDKANLVYSTRTVKTNAIDSLVNFDPNRVTSTEPIVPSTSSNTPITPITPTQSTEPTSSETTNEVSSDVSSVPDESTAPQSDLPEASDVEGEGEGEGNDQDANGDPQDKNDEDKGGLPIGAIIGIIVGAVVIIGAVVAVIIIVKKKKA